jgi:hypothetical protein
VNGGPPGSTWSDPGPARSWNADSTRGRHLRALVHSRPFSYGLVLGSVGAVLAGAWLHSLVVILAAPPVVVAVALVAAFVAADNRSEADFFIAYASSRGCSYAGRTRPLPLTPLLGAGDRRRCDHWMQGRLSEGLDGGLGHYTFETDRRGQLGQNSYRNTRHFTICMVDLEAGIRLFPGIFLCARRGLFGRLDGEQWLSHHNRHEVELESAELCEGHELWVDDGQDELLLRELFAPSLQVLLAEHPLEPCFEYRAGTLVVYVERTLSDEGHLDWMREVTAKIAGHFGAEIEERRASSAHRRQRNWMSAGSIRSIPSSWR